MRNWFKLLAAVLLVAVGVVVGLWMTSDQHQQVDRVDGRRLTQHELKFPDGNLKETRDVLEKDDGTLVMHGTRTLYYESGKKKAELPYRDGLQEGNCAYWYENGQKKAEGYFKHGKRHGRVTTWHENGEKASDGNYVDGVVHGTLTTWLQDGRKLESVEYRMGQKHGSAQVHSADGEVTTVTYVDGKLQRDDS